VHPRLSDVSLFRFDLLKKIYIFYLVLSFLSVWKTACLST